MCGKVLIAGVYRGGFCEKLQEASPYLIKPVPASSKTDLPLAKAKPMSNGGSTSVIAYVRRGRKKNCREMAVDGERGVRLCERNNSADTKVSEEGRGGGARDAGAKNLPLQLMMKTMVRQVVSLQPMEVHGGADSHL